LVFWKKSLGQQTKIQNLRPALFLVYLEKTMYLKPMKPTLIVLTGAVSGIGRALFSTFSQRQIPMILLDLEEEKLKKMTEGLPFVDWVAGSVAEPSTWGTVLEKGSKSGFIISHLINCAGVIRPGFLEDFALEDIDFHLDCNTKGSILGTTLVGRLMKKQRGGHIINISSLAGLAPVSGLSLYTASKFAIRGFSLSVAAELKQHGVWVTVICPDLVNTPMLDLQLDYPEEAKLTFSGPSQVLQPEDVVKVIEQVMNRPRAQVCIPEARGLLAKIAGAWPAIGEWFRKSLEKKGEKELKKRASTSPN
jgi:3-oxoacyl-[acyl-carrier protein] reductase